MSDCSENILGFSVFIGLTYTNNAALDVAANKKSDKRIFNLKMFEGRSAKSGQGQNIFSFRDILENAIFFWSSTTQKPKRVNILVSNPPPSGNLYASCTLNFYLAQQLDKSIINDFPSKFPLIDVKAGLNYGSVSRFDKAPTINHHQGYCARVHPSFYGATLTLKPLGAPPSKRYCFI